MNHLRAAWLLLCLGLAPAGAGASLPQLQFQAERLQVAGQELVNADIRCTAEAGDALGCEWAVDGLDGSARVLFSDDSTRVTAELSETAFYRLLRRPEMPEAGRWVSAGRLSLAWAAATAEGPVSPLRLDVRGLSFDSPDGRFAAEGLDLELQLDADGKDGAEWRVSGRVPGGQLLIDDFYRDWSQGPLSFAFHPGWDGQGWRIESLEVDDGRWLSMRGRLEGRFGSEDPLEAFEMHRLRLAFPGAYSAYLENFAAAYTLNGLQVTGVVNWSGSWSEGRFQSGDLVLDDVTVVDTQRGRFAFTGLDAHLRPGDFAFDSRLDWQGLIFGRINLGAGTAALDSEPGIVALQQPLELDVLGGRVTLQEFRMALPGSEALGRGDPDFRLAVHLEDIAMEQVTTALDWPLFAGTISGDIPAVSLRNGVLDVDGAIEFDVFGGRLSMKDVRMERPFGVLPSVAANLSLENIDLGELTQVFSFGRISGRMDGYVNDLRLLDWQPVQFDAWLGTPESQSGKKDISRQAVNHLTSIGGGNATAALTGPLMRLFNNFSYRRLGLGCRLENNVCDVRGLQDDGEGVLILEGAGVPKITIRAYNRHMDWPQLVANLAAVSEDNAIRIGD